MTSEVSQRQLATIWQKISAPPTSCLKRVYLDTVVLSIHQLEYLIRQYGADHVLLGTDYPYDMGESDPVGHVERVPGLSAAERRATATTTRCGCSSWTVEPGGPGGLRIPDAAQPP